MSLQSTPYSSIRYLVVQRLARSNAICRPLSKPEKRRGIRYMSRLIALMLIPYTWQLIFPTAVF